MKSTRASDAVEFPKVLEAEARQIQVRRGANVPPNFAQSPGAYLGVSFSGGGIRSATFNLGILQGLAQRGLLPSIDYLSTVSGGGYLGTWLHAVIRRYGAGKPAGAVNLLSPKLHPVPGPAEEDPISFLRKYSSYLAPSLGLFSADFWVILVIWFRNMMLNQLILVPLLAGISLVAMLILFLATPAIRGGGDSLCAVVWAAVLLLTAGAIAAGGVKPVVSREDCSKEDDAKVEGKPVGDGQWKAGSCTVLIFVACLVLACSSFALTSAGPLTFLIVAGVLSAIILFVLQWKGGFLISYRAHHENQTSFAGLWLIAFPLVAGAVSALLLFGSMRWIAAWDGPWHVVAWGPPLLVLACIVGTGLHIGLMGADFPDFGREWLARTGAYAVIAAFAWALLFAIGVFGPYWVAVLALDWTKTAVTGMGAWLTTTVSGVLSGKSDRTSGAGGDAQGADAQSGAARKSGVLDWIANIAPTVFLVGFLLLISFGVHVGLHGFYQHVPDPQRALAEPCGNWLTPIVKEYWHVLDRDKNTEWEWAPGFLAIALSLGLVLPFRFNINEFSLHHFYKNRLVRCYLGASRGKARSPSRLTGFDPCDDFPLTSLLADPAAGLEGCIQPKAADAIPYYGPYPIINGTVNMTHGSELAKQERQGESFVFTPLYCGFNLSSSPEDRREVKKGRVSKGGYHPTCGYGYPAGLQIGTSMAISGAAANPNHGYHTSAPMAFLMTIFDVRLGWWLGNPRLRKPSTRPGPLYALQALLSELFAQTDQRASYLNISDGGQFENLGIYELVRRRCKYIIAGDGEQDQQLTFSALGGAVRKCRADFGVEIDIDPHRIHPLKDRASITHCVVGNIKYPEDKVTGAPEEHGLILYLKSSLTGDEPEDVAQYHADHPDFPHETTANQFFTESQFESYRRLGQHVVESAFQNVVFDPAEKRSIDDLFKCLYQQWYPPSQVSDGVYSRHADAYSLLMKRLSDDADLSYFDSQVVRDNAAVERTVPPDRKAEIERKAFFYCLDLIQLMENVWSDVHLHNLADRSNPNNAGWIAVFQHWARQPLFQETWARAGYTYNPLFQQFFYWAAGGLRPKGSVKPPCGDLPV